MVLMPYVDGGVLCRVDIRGGDACMKRIEGGCIYEMKGLYCTDER